MRAMCGSLVSLVLAVACFASGCRSKPETGTSSLYPDDLSGDAHRTYAAYVRAVNAGTEQRGSEIPRAYWAASINALHPLKVYTHRVNLVVVQEVADGTEKGKYISIPVSSYLPRSGDDGFEFTSIGNGICEFTRTKTR